MLTNNVVTMGTWPIRIRKASDLGVVLFRQNFRLSLQSIPTLFNDTASVVGIIGVESRL
jgi:hypothetical protein